MSLKFSLIEEVKDDENSTILSTQFEPQMYEFEFTSHYRVDKYLDSLTTQPCPNTIIGHIQSLLEEHGWKRAKPWIMENATKERNECIEPITQSPSIHFLRLYSMIGFDSSEIEKFICSHVDPEFSITSLMILYCHRYGIHISKTFPSTRNTIANREISVGKGGWIRSKKIKVNDGLDKIGYIEGWDDDEPFIYDNDQLNSLPSLENADPPKTKKKKRNSEKPMSSNAYHRVIPLSILPLFLSMFPSYYQNANTLVYECEMLEIRIRNKPNLANNTRYVIDQVDAMGTNRRYMSFVHQCLFLNESEERLSDYERTLYENEILQLKMEFVASLEEREKKNNNNNNL